MAKSLAAVRTQAQQVAAGARMLHQQQRHRPRREL